MFPLACVCAMACLLIDKKCNYQKSGQLSLPSHRHSWPFLTQNTHSTQRTLGRKKGGIELTSCGEAGGREKRMFKWHHKGPTRRKSLTDLFCEFKASFFALLLLFHQTVAVGAKPLFILNFKICGSVTRTMSALPSSSALREIPWIENL